MSSGQEARGSGRSAAERLLGDLWNCSKDRRTALLRETRFHSRTLLDLLLEECQAALPSEPARGDEIVEMAAVLVSHFSEGEGRELLELKSHSYRLGSPVQRLFGDHRGPETFFEQAALLDVSRPARGFQCWGLGRLPWDQARCDEAAALLNHVARQFQQAGWVLVFFRACLALAGLLAVEQIAVSESEGLLDTAQRCLNRQCRPWLVCRTRAEAQTARERAWRFYQDISHEKALGLIWPEGRVALELCHSADALQLLDSVRRKLLTARRLSEAILATIDLWQGLVESGSTIGIGTLVEELAKTFEGRPGLEVAVVSLFSFEANALGRRHRLCTRSALRQLFCAEGVFFQRAPYA